MSQYQVLETVRGIHYFLKDVQLENEPLPYFKEFREKDEQEIMLKVSLGRIGLITMYSVSKINLD